jgi:hypothetical protein
MQLCGKSGKFKYPLVEFIFKVFYRFLLYRIEVVSNLNSSKSEFRS